MGRRYVPRGNCPSCGYRFPLLVDGAMAKHRDPRYPREVRTCDGSWQPSKWAEHNRLAREKARVEQ
jgi:hypothetical protein